MSKPELCTEKESSSRKVEPDVSHGLIKKDKTEESSISEYSETVKLDPSTNIGENDLSIRELASEFEKKSKSASSANKFITNLLLIIIYIIIWFYFLRNVIYDNATTTVFDSANKTASQIFLVTSAFILVLAASFLLMIDYRKLMFIIHSRVYSYHLMRFSYNHLALLLRNYELVTRIRSMFSENLLFHMSMLLFTPFIFILLYLIFRNSAKSVAVVLIHTNFYGFRSVLFHCFLDLFVSVIDVVLIFFVIELKKAFNILDYVSLFLLGIIHFAFVKFYVIISTVEVLKRRSSNANDTQYKNVTSVDKSSREATISDVSESNEPGTELFGTKDRKNLFCSVVSSIASNLSFITLSCVFSLFSVFRLLPFGINKRIRKSVWQYFCYNLIFTLVVSVYEKIDCFDTFKYKNKKLGNLLKAYQPYKFNIPFLVSLAFSMVYIYGPESTINKSIIFYFLLRTGIALNDFIYAYGLYFIYYHYRNRE
ncbi:hypothetical protein VCUG_00770 [Vavraia culicis subsp. floridensis]|uniref:Uncharacterized protein n=1 Tax=Vavraia culicis (isolate floridensis) TaxID=948595 RepID=L2GWL5_VAVCU|nr:uncharacterized protein VCUG_00770 [Vavraia culicis subsp. floridensis]ELA47688.1 hypothetical protein VCUG_00770 [Vavraia culicis subsp. floridensis]